jgi:hypothetical protein
MGEKKSNHIEYAVKNGKRTPKMAETQRMIQRAEKLLDGPLISFWNSESGGKIFFYCAEALQVLLTDLPFSDRLFLCLTSDGGSGLASLRIANLLRSKCKKLIVLVPMRAESAATMLALAADEIHLAPHANLSPVDTSIQHSLCPVNQSNDQANVGQDELSRIVTLWRKESKSEAVNPYAELWRYIHPLVIGAVDRANSLSLKLCETLLAYHMKDPALRKRIATALTGAYPAHNYPILFQEAKEMGIPVKKMEQGLENILASLQQQYVEAGELRRIDQDQDHHHDHEIPTIAERAGSMVLFRSDHDWYYRTEERRWLPMHKRDSWYQAELRKGKTVERALHIQ